MIELWTDGCCIKRATPKAKGVGGWAYVAVARGKVIAKAAGAEPKTTNNRMEMMAAIEALSAFPEVDVTVISDSRYVVEGAMHWMQKWRNNGWVRKGRNGKAREVANRKLWKEIARLMEDRKVVFKWVKGHNGSTYNEMADFLAGEAAEGIAADVH